MVLVSTPHLLSEQKCNEKQLGETTGRKTFSVGKGQEK